MFIVLEILNETGNVDADIVTSMLKREGLEELPIPGGIHLARTLIDLKLQKMEEEHQHPQEDEMYTVSDE